MSNRGISPIVLSEVPVISSRTGVIEGTRKRDTIISQKPGKTKYPRIVLVMNTDHIPEHLRNWRHETIEGVSAEPWGRAITVERETGKVRFRDTFTRGIPLKLTSVNTGGTLVVNYEIAVTTIQSRRFPPYPAIPSKFLFLPLDSTYLFGIPLREIPRMICPRENNGREPR